MINIRRNVFETNSSSMHSLVVVKEPKPYKKQELRFDVWDTAEEFKLFDWGEDGVYERSPYRVLRTPLDKLRYYVAYTLGACKEYDKIPVIKELIHKQTGIDEQNITLEHIHEHYDRKRDQYIESRDYGCVYPNDTGEDPFEFIKRKGITMEDLIMNPKYVIITDGDEYQLFKALFESNILNADDFEDISSGADFWNDAQESIYINWLRKDNFHELTDEDLADRVNKFTKKLVFLIDSDSRRFYQPNIERIKHIIELAKVKNPKIITVLEHTHLDNKHMNVNNLDTSMFDEVHIKND